ncbi:hypothetical protein ABT084_27235 [Streptomyces sp. NPDC002138]|uniref:hypothetical protein n=1 Tax=Streptomyces sp. NPDC002138 TaxID=3154410 RepID=UPI003317A692
MQLRRAVPLSLVVLLAGTGCASVGDASPDPGPPRPAPAPATAPASAPAEDPVLPLGRVAGPSGPAIVEPDPAPTPRHSPGERAMQPSAPRRTTPRKPAPAHPRRYVAPAPARLPGQAEMDELCAAAEGSVPPSVLDLCVGRYGG